MIYYLTGLSARNILLEDLCKEYNSIKVYDAYIKEDYEAFLEDISNVSIFSLPELVILKRANKLKKMDELIKYLQIYTNDNKSIVIDYEYKYKTNNPYIKTFEKLNANILNVNDEVEYITSYVMKNLSITKVEARKILDLTGYNYEHIKNEVYKYKSLLNGEEFDFNKIKDLIVTNTESQYDDLITKLHEKTLKASDIPNQMLIGFIYCVYKEFETLHKLEILDLPKNYEDFKREYSDKEKYFNDNYYKIFKKLKYKNYTSDAYLKVLDYCNYVEKSIKTGLFDDKTAVWLLINMVEKL